MCHSALVSDLGSYRPDQLISANGQTLRCCPENGANALGLLCRSARFTSQKARYPPNMVVMYGARR